MTIEPNDIGMLCVAAIRYCQGRQTYMPDLIRGIVRPLLPELPDDILGIMRADCAFQSGMNLYGDEKIDKPGWIRWREELDAESRKRQNKRG